MKTRRGRCNIVKFVNEKFIQKIGIVKEEVRPYRLMVESWAISQSRSKGINVPRVIDYYLNPKGQEVLILERIHGKSLSFNMLKSNANCILDVGRQMSLLNNIGVNYGWIDPISYKGSNENWQSFISWYTQTYGERLVEEKIIKENDFIKIYKMTEQIDLNISVAHLVNRDIKLPNIIKDNKGKIWIVDWENAILGDPLYDLALFGIKYGHGILWENLKLGYEIEQLPIKYDLYEIIGLIGIIDFYQKNNINHIRKLKQIQKLIVSI